MRIFKNIPGPVWVFALIWFIAGCLQAGFTELHPDEAYYWQTSRIMDWGYFHQPPMIAVFIRIGYSLFQNELGVRLLTVLASTLGFLMLFKLADTKDHRTFILIFLGLILTHAGVFMAVPDSPLILFTLVFLVLLKEYLQKDSFLLAIALAIVAAALMYSKYHAIVLIALTIAAAPRLLLRRSFWAITVLATVLFLPHVLWQFQHDLISFKFHWLLRDKKLWHISVLLNYLSGQLIMLGPVGLILIASLFKLKKRSEFDRVLLFVLVGFFGFFLIMAFRGRVEANWTAIAFLPLIILGSRAISGQPKLKRILWPTAILSAAILISMRIYIASPWAGVGIKTSFPLKGWSAWATKVKQKADGRPVFFANSYQMVSEYSFYSKEQGYHLSLLNYNGNQFDIWDIDKAEEGRPIALLLGFGNDSSKAVKVDGFKTMFLYEVDDYHSFRNLRFEFDSGQYRSKTNSTLDLNAQLINRTGIGVNLDSLVKERPLKLFFYLNGEQTPARTVECRGCSGKLAAGESKPVSFIVNVPDRPGKYLIRFGLDVAMGMPEANSDFVKLLVTED